MIKFIKSLFGFKEPAPHWEPLPVTQTEVEEAPVAVPEEVAVVAETPKPEKKAAPKKKAPAKKKTAPKKAAPKKAAPSKRGRPAKKTS